MGDMIRIIQLQSTGDERGNFFSSPSGCPGFIRPVEDIHIATIVPGSCRGNHYHEQHRELLLVIYSDQWTLYWDNGRDTATQKSRFEGSGAVMLEIEPLASHAVYNDGTRDMYILALSNRPYDPKAPDTHTQQLVNQE